MNVSVTKNGSNISSYVVSYERTRNICTGVGTLQLVVDRDYSGFDTWDTIKIFEGGKLKGTYFASQIDDEQPSSTITVYAQDASKYLVDYFIDEVFTIVEPEYNKTWIIKFLNDAGINDIKFTTSDPGTLISNNTTLGLSNTYDQLMYLVQISGWYFHFDANNTCVIGKLDTDISSPKAKLTPRNIVEIRKIEHDKMFRNRVVVWGRGSGFYGNAVGVEAFKITPWNYDSKDLRTIAIVNSNIPSSGIAQRIADEALDYFDEISIEKHIIAEGAVNLEVGDACSVNSNVWRGKGLVTTFGTSMSKDGLVSHVILDEKCPRLFAYYDFGDYVYIGTVDSGVYRKHIKYGVSGWYDFNGGDLIGSGTGVNDLFVYADLADCVTFSGDAFYTYVEETPTNWHIVDLSNISGEDANGTPVLLSDPDIKARACTIDRTTYDFRFLLDTWSGQNYKNYVDMYYHRFSSPYLFSGQLYSGIAPLGLFSISGYLLGSGDSTWVISVPPTGEGTIGVFPITFSGLTVGSGGYSVVGFDLENDGVYDYASVFVDRPPIFYINTVYNGENYITGINAHTRELITHIHSSGLVVNTTVPEEVICQNIGNIFSSRRGSTYRTVLLDNHTINSTIPVTISGEYDFGISTRYPDYRETDYVSLMAVPSGTFMDDIIITTNNYTSVDKIGNHEVVRYVSTGNGSLDVKNYSFDSNGWNYIDTNTINIPAIGTGPFSVLFPPTGDYIFTYGGNAYSYLTYRQTNSSPNMYIWYAITAYSGGYVDVEPLSEEISLRPQDYLEYIDDGKYVLCYGGGGIDPLGGTVGGTASHPRYMQILDFTGEVDSEPVIVFDGLSSEFFDLAADGLAWYRLKIFRYQNTFQVIGFVFVYRQVILSGENKIYVYPISGLSGKAPLPDINSPLYIETDVDAADPQISFDYVSFSRKWSLAYYEAKASNPIFGQLGDTKASVLNYGPHGAYVIDPLTQWLGGTSYTDFPWTRGASKLPTLIADPIFDNYAVMAHNTDGLFISIPPFTERGEPVDLGEHDLASRPYPKPESNQIKSYMVLRREGNDYDIVAGGYLPYRLDSSHPSPLVTSNLFRFSFETYFVGKDETTVVSQLHPITDIFASGQTLSSGVGFDIINDFRYTTFGTLSESGYGQVLLYTTSGGLWTTPLGDYSTFNLYSGYVDSTVSGVIVGSASMIETSNYAYPDQYVFLSTIAGPNDFRFYQKSPSGVFEDCSLYSGYPNSEICIIRLEDIV